MRNRRRAIAVLGAALAAACRRAPPPPAADPSGGVTLAAPPAGIASPLGPATTSYTNEMQEQNLRDQAASLGIKKFAKPSDPAGDDDGRHETITYEEGLERTRASAREFEAERHAIDRDKEKTVAIPTPTPEMIPGRREGSPIESPAENSGSKDPAAN